MLRVIRDSHRSHAPLQINPFRILRIFELRWISHCSTPSSAYVQPNKSCLCSGRLPRRAFFDEAPTNSTGTASTWHRHSCLCSWGPDPLIKRRSHHHPLPLLPPNLHKNTPPHPPHPNPPKNPPKILPQPH